MSKEIFYKILYKLMCGKLRNKYKELYKKEKSLRLVYERAVKDIMFVLIKENGEEVRNPKIEGLTVEFYGKDSVVEIREPYWFDDCIFAGIPARLVKSGRFSWTQENCYDHSIGNYFLKDKK